MLNISSINQYYRESHTFEGLDLEAKQASAIGLMGRNRLGKNSLLKCVMGIESMRDDNIKL